MNTYTRHMYGDKDVIMNSKIEKAYKTEVLETGLESEQSNNELKEAYKAFFGTLDTETVNELDELLL